MRIAVGDPGCALITDVFVDGVKRLDVVALDTVEGWAEVIVTDPERPNVAVTENGELVRRTIYGRIEVHGEVPVANAPL